MRRQNVQAAWAGLTGVVVGAIVGALFAQHRSKKSRDDIMKIAKDLRGKR